MAAGKPSHPPLPDFLQNFESASPSHHDVAAFRKLSRGFSLEHRVTLLADALDKLLDPVTRIAETTARTERHLRVVGAALAGLAAIQLVVAFACLALIASSR